jgi:hypothetical protein
MHQLVMLRGHIDFIEKFVRELRSNYVDFEKYDENLKKKVKFMMPIRVCPVQLYDISFPEGARDSILNTILPKGSVEDKDGGSQGHKAVNRLLGPIRLALGLKKTAPIDRNKGHLRMAKPEHMDITSIGERKDYWIEPDGRHVKSEDKSDLAWEGI